MQNGKVSKYDLSDQHTTIDANFCVQIDEGNEQNTSNFLSLPEIILAKKGRRHQPLLDYTTSRILTSSDCVTGLEVLAKKEATAVVGKKKKEEKEATKEQRKALKEQQQSDKEERGRKKQEKEMEIQIR